MHYYQHHIGDFNKATRHLTRLERSIYRDLLELYYDIEGQLPLDLRWICRRILANSNEELTSAEQMLNEFFTETPNGWYHSRCDLEIHSFKTSTSQKSIAGKASAAKKAERKAQALNGESTSVQHALNGTSTNQEPRTINLEPLTKEDTAQAPKFNFAKELEIMGVEENAITTWLAVRKKKKAVNSEIALEALKREALKAGFSVNQAVLECCTKSWSGFSADWVINSSGGKKSTHNDFSSIDYTKGINDDGSF